MSDYIPYTRYLDVGGYKKEMKMVAKDMDNVIEGWLKEHKRDKESRDQHEGNQAFIDVLISILHGSTWRQPTMIPSSNPHVR